MRKFGAAAVLLATLVALALVTPGARAEAVVPVAGPWTGATSVGLPVHFSVEGGNVVNASFGFHWGECGNFTSRDPNLDPIDPEGNWSFANSEGQTIEGRFVAADRVEGTIRSVERELPGCPSTHATFVAIPGEVGPPVPAQYYAVQTVRTGYEERLPWTLYIGKVDGFWFYHLHWRDWGKSVTYAHGQSEIRRFKKHWVVKVHVRLSRPVPDGPHKRLYSVMRWWLSGRLPPHFPPRGELTFHAPRHLH